MRRALSPTSGVVLDVLRASPSGQGLTTADIIERTGLGRAAAGSALVRLEADGLVRRYDHQWRLTAFGRRVVPHDGHGTLPACDAAVADDAVLRSVARLATLRATRYPRALPDEGLGAIARRARTATKADIGFVTLLDDERCLIAATAPAALRLRTGADLAVEHSLCREVVVRGVPVLIPDTRADGRARSYRAVEALGLGAYAGIPLTVGGQVLGALCVASWEPRPFDARMVRALDGLAAETEALLRAGRPGSVAVAA